MKKKEKTAATMAAYKAGTLDEEKRAQVDRKKAVALAKKRANESTSDVKVFGGGVVIDLGFDSLMTDMVSCSLDCDASNVKRLRGLTLHPVARRSNPWWPNSLSSILPIAWPRRPSPTSFIFLSRPPTRLD